MRDGVLQLKKKKKRRAESPTKKKKKKGKGTLQNVLLIRPSSGRRSNLFLVVVDGRMIFLESLMEEFFCGPKG